MKKKKIKDVAEIYEKKSCNVSATCKALNISRTTFYEWKKGNKELAEALENAEESMLDWAESKLLKAINDDNLTALIFFLKTKGKKRGYTESSDQNLTINPFQKLMMEIDEEDAELDDEIPKS